MALEFADKNVLIVDGKCITRPTVFQYSFYKDSIVRGTTSKEIIQMAKDVGSRKVIVASCAPPIRYDGPKSPFPSFLMPFGIDTPTFMA
jgi:amidophosphoribosyltransferase